MKQSFAVGILLVLMFTGPREGTGGEKDLAAQAEAGLRRAVDSFRKNVAVEGAYLWRYSEDLARREGEAKATATMAWVQPPGTPSIGLAYLQAYEASRDKFYLEAARETAGGLIKGQLRSGGWDYRIEFDPAKRSGFAYRLDPAGKGKNVSTLDDNTTQEAIRFLMRLDRTLDFKDKAVHEAVDYALTSLLKAQYPNGAWAQRFAEPPDPAKHPVKKAAFPETWSRTWPKLDYAGFYTLNDNVLADVVDVLLEAGRIYKDERYLQAVERAGDFLILAQLPDPQPAWAQQYDFDMHPAWARKFEPASVTGGESAGALRTLLRLYRETGKKKYLEPIPKALAFFDKVKLPGNRLARFYELKTSKPLYFTKEYVLTYEDNDLPTHYAFKVGNSMDKIAKDYELALKLDPAKIKTVKKADPGPPSAALIGEVKKVLAAQDGKGRWVEPGKLKHHGADDPTKQVIDSRTFIRNVGVLSQYLAATRK